MPTSAVILVLSSLTTVAAAGGLDGVAHTFVAGTPTRVEVAGWSADERSFALRVIAYEDVEAAAEMGADRPPCEGYVDDKGEQFSGELSLLIFQGAKLVGRHPIQDGTADGGAQTDDGCTPPAVAKARLSRAKADMKKRGVDAKRKGTKVEGSDVTLTPAGAEPQKLRLNEWMQKKPDKEGMNVDFSTTFALRHNDKVLKRLKRKGSFQPIMASDQTVSVGPHFVSPSQKTVVFLVNEEFTSMRGGSTTTHLFGVYGWEKGKLVSR
jgi:hypothetical protein